MTATDLSRRSFVKGVGIGTTAAAIMAMDGGRWSLRAASLSLPEAGRPLLLHNNENPLGPGARVLAAMNEALEGGPRAGRYPFSAARALAETIAGIHDLPTDSVMIGNGSTQLLRTATQVFTTRTRHLVAGAPSYEEASSYAGLIGNPVQAIPLDSGHELDLDAMAYAAHGAGLVFLDNPNNPAGTLHDSATLDAFIDRVLSETDATVLVDEAYHDYVTHPRYQTQIPRALSDERVVVTRTFSKAHGMAGMRVGWLVAHPNVISKLREWHYGLSLNIPALIGATASIQDADRIRVERDRNTKARQFTLDWCKARGITTTNSETNFILARTGVPASTFRYGCAGYSVKVGRDFPPYHDEWSRISISTIEDMERAVEVFDQVLGTVDRKRADGSDPGAAA